MVCVGCLGQAPRAGFLAHSAVVPFHDPLGQPVY
jgi:hypothetical protein